DATKGEIAPPIIESLKTKTPAIGINHKLMMLFETNTTPYPIESARAFAEPNLEFWLKKNIGRMDNIACLRGLYNSPDESLIETIEVTLADLKISYLDFLYLSEDSVSKSAGELELRIWKAVVKQRGDLPENIKYVITSTGL